MHKLIVVIFLCFPVLVHAQEVLTYQYVDSLTYDQYLRGEWDCLIQTGKKALKQGIDFKYLQQRLGYAYYMKSDYYEAMRYYEKALTFDKLDEGSNLYLYYAGMNIGNIGYARHYAGKLSSCLQKDLRQAAIKPVNAVDIEYSYKWNAEATRSDPRYVRIGINTPLGYALNLYQSVSRFNQYAVYQDDSYEYRSTIVQDEYYALLSANIDSRLGAEVGYHYVNAGFNTDYWDLTWEMVTQQVDTLNYPGHLFYADIHYKWYRFNLGISGSVFTMNSGKTEQVGLHLGVGLPGSHNLYLKNSVYCLNDDDGLRFVSSHSIGLLFWSKIWLEGDVTFGNQNNFSDMNGMYVYNSFDPTLFKAGSTIFWYANKRFTLFANVALDIKQNAYLLNEYQQKSLAGGIIWKF